MWGGGTFAESVLIRVTPDGEVHVAADGMAVPNGMAMQRTDRRSSWPSPAPAASAASASPTTALADRERRHRSRRRRAPPTSRPTASASTPAAASGGPTPWATASIHVPTVTSTVTIPGRRGHPLACVLGGPDRRTLFVCVGGQRLKPTRTPEPTGRVLTFEADVPGEGRP